MEELLSRQCIGQILKNAYAFAEETRETENKLFTSIGNYDKMLYIHKQFSIAKIRNVFKEVTGIKIKQVRSFDNLSEPV